MVFKNAKMFSLFPKCICFLAFLLKRTKIFSFYFCCQQQEKNVLGATKMSKKLSLPNLFSSHQPPKMSQKIHFFKRRKILLWSAKFTTELPFQNVKFTRTHTMEVWFSRGRSKFGKALELDFSETIWAFSNKTLFALQEIIENKNSFEKLQQISII